MAKKTRKLEEEYAQEILPNLDMNGIWGSHLIARPLLRAFSEIQHLYKEASNPWVYASKLKEGRAGISICLWVSQAQANYGCVLTYAGNGLRSPAPTAVSHASKRKKTDSDHGCSVSCKSRAGRLKDAAWEPERAMAIGMLCWREMEVVQWRWRDESDAMRRRDESDAM